MNKDIEQEMADWLMRQDEESPDDPYTRAYETIYAQIPAEQRRAMCEKYMRGAKDFAQFVRKHVGLGKTVLEPGCGFGHLTKEMAQWSGRVVGLDVNRMHVQEAQKAYGSIQNVEFRHTQGTHLDFQDCTFDAVVSNSVYEHLRPKDVPAHLREVRRVLEPTGIYICNTTTCWLDLAMGRMREDSDQKGMHINEGKWALLRKRFGEAGFRTYSTILPSRWAYRSSFPSMAIPVSWKAMAEKLLPKHPLLLKIFRLHKALLIARRP